MSESEIINDLKRESNDDENEQTLRRTQPTFEDNQVIVFCIFYKIKWFKVDFKIFATFFLECL